MKEIKTVMDRLKKEYDNLEQENITATQSISEKQNSINTLTDEINALQAEIETRKENMAKLQQKIAETEAFERSIDEVVPLMREEEAQAHEADYLSAVEKAMDDAKIEESDQFTFRNNLDVFGGTEEEKTTEEDKTAETEEVTEEKPMDEMAHEEEVPAMSFMGTPASEDVFANPDYTLNEAMYNGAAQDMTTETPAMGTENPVMGEETHFVPENNGVNAMAQFADVYNPLDSQEIDSTILR